MNVARYEGGRTVVRKAAIVAAVALALTILGALVSGERALWSYHVAFVYWSGIALGALILNMSFQAGKAKWYVVMRRLIETIPLSGGLFLVLFIPILIWAPHIFGWLEPAHLHDEHVRQLAEHRRPYLNMPFFVIRAAIYFALWIVVANLLYRWSVRQDTEGGIALTLKQRRLGAGALPFVALAMSFAAFDWQMSVDLHLESTIFGIYWFAGSFLAAFSVVVLWLNAMRGTGLPGSLVNANHYHALGKYMLAFTAFWAYIAFSQYLLIWIANLPHEVPFFLARAEGGWRAFGVALVVLHFLVPFFILLSRDLKRNPKALGWMSVFILFIHYVDIYWIVMPALQHGEPHLHWTDLTAFVGVGAAALAFVAWRLGGQLTVPVKDPYLEVSLRYDPS